MNRTSITFILLAAFFTVSAGLIYHNSTSGEMLETMNVKIQKDNDNVWRVRDNMGVNRGAMRAKGKDKINWQAQGSDVEFRFHKNVNAYFDFEEGMFADGQNQRIENSKMLRVTLKDTAPKDSLVYDVYVYSDESYVVGNSPPVLIVY